MFSFSCLTSAISFPSVPRSVCSSRSRDTLSCDIAARWLSHLAFTSASSAVSLRPTHKHDIEHAQEKDSKEHVKQCMFYTAQYPVRWTAQSALYFSSPGRPVHSDTNSTSLGSILAMKQLHAKTIHSHVHRFLDKSICCEWVSKSIQRDKNCFTVNMNIGSNNTLSDN